MKANELMIGDWVYDTILRGYTKVELLSVSGIRGDIHESVYNENSFEPIPLTPEILEKNGFSDDYRDDALSYAQSCGDVIGIHINGKNGLMEEMYFDYVHQLQNALRLCGIDKNIEL